MRRLLTIADHSLVVQAIRLALRQTAGFQVVGFIDGRSSATPALLQLRPDIVLVDDMQDQEHALARLREVGHHLGEAKSVLLTQRKDAEWLDDAFEAGAHAVISKGVHPVALGTLLREIANDNVLQRFRLRREVEAIEHCPLTDRELQILHLVVEGHTNGHIARELWVTEQTVKFHLSNTYRKLGVANRTEATRYAHVHDLVSRRQQLAS